MSEIKKTIEVLFSDSGAFDEGEIVNAIQPFVTIQKTSNDIFLKDSKLTIDQVILVYGLTKKLLKHKNFIDSEFITALEVHQKTGIKKGSIDPMVKKLKDAGWLVGKREYEIPNYKISKIIEIINK